MVKNDASSHKTNYIHIFSEIPNLEGHQNLCIGSKVTAVLLNWWILPTGGVALGRFCVCSLCSRLVLLREAILEENLLVFGNCQI